MSQEKKSVLVLGDSYSIGEGVSQEDSWPFQLVETLTNKGYQIQAPHVLAKTGWTSGELIDAIVKENIQHKYDFVFLLIGVNNQYRGYLQNEFNEDLRKLIDYCATFSLDKKNIFLISIPDWGNTPFASDRNIHQISAEIDSYNNLISLEAADRGLKYIYITDLTRISPINPDLLAADGLHPSGKMYATWIPRIMDSIANKIN